MAKNKDTEGIQEYVDNFIKIGELYQQVCQKALKNNENEDDSPLSPYKSASAVYAKLLAKLLEEPESLYTKQIQLYTDYLKIWDNAWHRYIGEKKTPLYNSDPKDKRFKDEAWNNDITFDILKQSYLLTNEWLQDTIGSLEGVDKKTRDKFAFYTKQFADAMAPSNFAATNPAVIRETINSKGENLVKGMHNLLHDLENSKQGLSISTADKNAFIIGKNIAATKGKVIFKNELMELLQYTPTTDTVYQKPLLIVPAWINKYYILDLSADNSFVKWACEQGYTVFMISWVNPDKQHAHKKFEDYMLDGPIAALTAIQKTTGEKAVNVLGYCLGGTILAATLSYMKTNHDTRVTSATLLTTMVDFGDAGDMSVFIDEEQLDLLDQQMQNTGFLDGPTLATIFNAIRANDLIWSFAINNYLLGKDLLPFDILYWNADHTRMPADTHSFYLRNTYLKNLLKKPHGITLANTAIDVTQIDTPTYILSTQDDHISPWQTTYKTTQLFTGPVKFVLAGSGHVAGVINHPNKNKYGYLINNNNPTSAKKWLSSATEHQGSWWTDWHKWQQQYAGKKINSKSRHPDKQLPNAPGKYVLQKC